MDSKNATPEIEIEVTRGDLVESRHRVVVCGADAHGKVVLSAGNPDELVYLRSALKPFIAAAVVRAGAIERFGLTMQEVAIIAGSHAGEPFHVATVRKILEKIGLDESALRCGIHAPRDERAAEAVLTSGDQYRAVHHNCSGKHAGLLALTRILQADLATYREVQHPTQQAVFDMYARVFDILQPKMHVGTDGCGIPVVAFSMWKSAMGFARLATLEQLDAGDIQALRTVRQAMLQYPEYIRGRIGLDTQVMQASNRAIVAKSGAEGVFAFGHVQRGLGFVIKVRDGNERAIPPVLVPLLECLFAGEVSLEFRVRYATVPIRNASEAVVGTISLASGDYIGSIADVSPSPFR